MTIKEQRFIHEFTVDCNRTKAAIRAGYSAATAGEAGCRLYKKPEIFAALQIRIKELFMPPDEATKHISDIANSRLNDFLVVKKVLKTTTVRKLMQQVINELDDEIAFENDYARIAKLTGDQLAAHKAEQKKREHMGIRYALELERNPKAYRDVPGPSEWVEEATIDLVALAKSKGEGRIKAMSYSEHGPKIELYPADRALETILKLNNKLIERKDITSNGKTFAEFLISED